MSEFWMRVEFAVVAVLSLVVFAGAAFVGLSDSGLGPLRAVAIAILLVGYLVHNATLGHLSPRQDTVLTGVFCLIGFVAVAWGVLGDGEPVSRGDLVEWGILLAAIAVLAGLTLLSRRRPE